jgi:predicted RNase H-like nuclease (RuvC/YqgF family)
MPDEKQSNQQVQQNNQVANETFETWLDKQDDQVKGLYTSHVSGLKSSLETERSTRKEAEKQLRELAKAAEAGSAAQKALTEQADRLTKLEVKAGFYDKAHAAGVRNLKLAYLAASQAGLINEKGEADFVKLKAEYPELFTSAASANAGAGTGGNKTAFSMNDEIRKKAGRQ